ncbi:UPF0158 family protein [Paenibacillus sp. GCM10027628]|uniref:UPF0158 family protein n=1 Tax=Paenibacillus sp. GCM10027628 TaxID=3273413 RepID=UPI00363702A1
MKELKLTEMQWKELVETYDIYMDEIEFFLNVETGETVTLRSYDRDDEDEELSETIEEGFNEIYYRVPHRESDEGYIDMVDFTETVSDARLRKRLNDVLNGGRKIFRRFKDTLSSDSSELQRYYDFSESRNRERVMEWLQDSGFKVDIIDGSSKENESDEFDFGTMEKSK